MSMMGGFPRKKMNYHFKPAFCFYSGYLRNVIITKWNALCRFIAHIQAFEGLYFNYDHFPLTDDENKTFKMKNITTQQQKTIFRNRNVSLLKPAYRSFSKRYFQSSSFERIFSFSECGGIKVRLSSEQFKRLKLLIHDYNSISFWNGRQNFLKRKKRRAAAF